MDQITERETEEVQTELDLKFESLLLWATFTAVCVSTLPERAFRRLESQVSCSADGVGCESWGAVVFRGNYPLPESSAILAFFRSACCGVSGSGTYISSVRNLTRDRKLMSFRFLIGSAFPTAAGNTCAEPPKSYLSLSGDWSIPATFKWLVQFLWASFTFGDSSRARDTNCVGELLRFGWSYSFPKACCFASLIFLDSDRLDARSLVNINFACVGYFFVCCFLGRCCFCFDPFIRIAIVFLLSFA